MEQARQIVYETAGTRPVPKLIHVMDREGDVYEVLMAIEEAGKPKAKPKVKPKVKSRRKSEP